LFVACRNKIPTCEVKGCNNATEVGIYKGMYTPSRKCYNCGGRIEYDGEPIEHKYLEYNKGKYICINGKLIPAYPQEIKDIDNIVYNTSSRFYNRIN